MEIKTSLKIRHHNNSMNTSAIFALVNKNKNNRKNKQLATRSVFSIEK
ncbi:hypothetical protein KBF61_03630 [Candidatus Saccharibacteria bacterium]|nr:hypothetical protein [Candidatus Saccharibacteria bacterium]